MLKNYQFSLGQITYTVRKLNGLTQVEFAKRLGVVQSTISKIEKDIFDDVPFSVISKISIEFNIPLNYFQIGLLPIRKNNSIIKIIPKNYINEGVFKAKTIHYVLREIKREQGAKIFKDVKLLEQYLCLSNVSYSFEFINKLYSLTQQNLIKAINEVSKEIELHKGFDFNNVYQHLLSTHGISITQEDKDNQKSIRLKFSSEIHELDKIYSELLKLELKLQFNCDFEINKIENTDEFELTALSYAS